MTDKAMLEFLVKTRDGLQQQLDATNEYLETLRPPAIENNLPDPAMVMFRDALGEHGAYKLADDKNNPNNPAFKHLQAYLRAHQGKATIQGEFFWLFKDDIAVGRKLLS